MAGAFATWQPRYAEAGIATFPVDAVSKKPSVKNALKGGGRASLAWAQKFPDASALGFKCGPSSGITVLDIDAPDENLLADSLDRFGRSPIIIRTATGKFHAWYKHNGEVRKIRPEKHIPIDLLGGGYAVAPPSNAGGGQYEFIEGSLNDLGRLRPMLRPGSADGLAVAQNSLAVGIVDEGKRNGALFTIALQLARAAGGKSDLIQLVSIANKARMNPPLDDSEVMRVSASAWDYQCSGKNWAGSGRRIVKSFDEIDAFAPIGELPHKAAPDAMFLLDQLRRIHYQRDTFFVANAMHKKLGWPLRRFVAARSYLENMGKLRVIKPPAKDAPAIYGF